MNLLTATIIGFAFIAAVLNALLFTFLIWVIYRSLNDGD